MPAERSRRSTRDATLGGVHRRVRLTVSELSLPLVHPFTIARGSAAASQSAIVQVAWRELVGLGETAPSERYGDRLDAVCARLRALELSVDDPYAVERLLDGLPPAARCALDLALHDLIGKDLDRPLWRLLGLDPTRTPVTSFTIGIDEPEKMLAKLDEIRTHPIVKVKLGGGDDVGLIAAIRARYTGTLRVDANEAWTPEEAVAKLRALERYELEFCEQPVAAGTPERLRWIAERTAIPLVADEDAQSAVDLPALRGCVAGVNVKLVKCGGIRAGLAMIATARALGLKVMLGCMLESAVLTTAAAQISPLVDWADLDGPFLTARDPFRGVTYERGKLVLPEGPGLGVVAA